MNVYDFDNTIYNGESTFDFFAFCVKENPALSKFIPPVVSTLIKYKLCRITAEELEKRCEKYMVDFLSRLDNPKELISRFWDINEHKIKEFYKNRMKPDDVIISASCAELLIEICSRLGIKNLIASEIDYKNHKVKQLCYGANKVKIFNRQYPDAAIDEFYSDSKNDLPMAKLAQKAYFVKKNNITEWKL